MEKTKQAKDKSNKLEAFETLEHLKKTSPINVNPEEEREKAIDEKYGVLSTTSKN